MDNKSLKFESKKQHIIWVSSKLKIFFVETNKKKYSELISEKSKGKEEQIFDTSHKLKKSDVNIQNVETCNNKFVSSYSDFLNPKQNIDYNKINEHKIKDYRVWK